MKRGGGNKTFLLDYLGHLLSLLGGEFSFRIHFTDGGGYVVKPSQSRTKPTHLIDQFKEAGHRLSSLKSSPKPNQFSL